MQKFCNFATEPQRCDAKSWEESQNQVAGIGKLCFYNNQLEIYQDLLQFYRSATNIQSQCMNSSVVVIYFLA